MLNIHGMNVYADSACITAIRPHALQGSQPLPVIHAMARVGVFGVGRGRGFNKLSGPGRNT